ncbi:hypothetical protein ABW21_db0209808 [Orbilia brochopaga]|nr:hypothetical protein ABW21_db0209808 [Drechslerella brochopaga]
MFSPAFTFLCAFKLLSRAPNSAFRVLPAVLVAFAALFAASSLSDRRCLTREQDAATTSSRRSSSYFTAGPSSTTAAVLATVRLRRLTFRFFPRPRPRPAACLPPLLLAPPCSRLVLPRLRLFSCELVPATCSLYACADDRRSAPSRSSTKSSHMSFVNPFCISLLTIACLRSLIVQVLPLATRAFRRC